MKHDLPAFSVITAKIYIKCFFFFKSDRQSLFSKQCLGDSLTIRNNFTAHVHCFMTVGLTTVSWNFDLLLRIVGYRERIYAWTVKLWNEIRKIDYSLLIVRFVKMHWHHWQFCGLHCCCYGFILGVKSWSFLYVNFFCWSYNTVPVIFDWIPEFLGVLS